MSILVAKKDVRFELGERHRTMTFWFSGSGRMLSKRMFVGGGPTAKRVLSPNEGGSGIFIVSNRNEAYPIQVMVNLGSNVNDWLLKK
jgi:hypothetical protein